MKIRNLGLLLIGWNLIGYPAFLHFAARRAKPFVARGDRAVNSIAVIIAAHNEEPHIGERVRNIFANGSRCEVIVVSDGSTDRTAEIALKEGATVIEQERSGKIAALHAGVNHSTADVIVITDANTEFEPGAIAALTAPLSDGRVGITAGDLVFEAANSASAEGEGAYWKYETAIKKNASRAGLLLMGAGGIYAFRREDWPQELPNDLADDSYVPLKLHRAGRRNLFIEEARATERAASTMTEEWQRRVRMVAQDTRVALRLSFGLPRPATFFALISQKVIRWNLFPLGIIVAAAKPGLILLGGIAAAAKPSIFYLAGSTAAATAGMLRGLFGKSQAAWEKAQSTRR